MPGQLNFPMPYNGTTTFNAETPSSIPWIVTVAANEVWQWQCIGITFTSSAVVATRYVSIEQRNNAAQVIYSTVQPVGQAASLVYRYHFQLRGETSTAAWSPGGGALVQLSHPLPVHYVEAGGDIRVVVFNTQAGDAFSNYGAYITKWRV